MNDFLLTLCIQNVSAQESIKETPSYHLCGRGPRIPTETVASYIRSPTLLISMRLGRGGINMALAGKQATENIESTQLAQKNAYNRKPTELNLCVRECVLVLMPRDTTGKDQDLTTVLQVTQTNAELRLIDQPKSDSINVILSREMKCR